MLIRNQPLRPRGHIPGGFRQLSAGQAVPDAVLSGTAFVRVKAQSLQAVPQPALIATASIGVAVRSLFSTQQVPDAVLLAAASTISTTGSLSASFQITSGSTGASIPFAFGHVFKKGDLPAGQFISGIQTTIKNTWSDGSARIAILAGVTSATAGVSKSITLQRGADVGGAAITTSDLKATGAAASIGCGAFGTASWATTDWDAPFQTWVSGPVMSSWIYRKAVGSDAHLVAWLEVRLWSTGAVEILPWVENGYLAVAGPTNKSATFTFTLGGTQRFSAVVDLKHHSRFPLIGASLSHWLGADPAVVPKHDTAYMQASGMVPTYGWTAPSAAALNALPTTYTPNDLGGVNSNMGTAGSSAAIIPNRQALYITSGGDARAYKGALVFGFSGGSWSTHYRDELTNHPIAFANRPSASLAVQDTPVIPDGTGGENGTAVTTHQPSFGYLPALITGRFWFFEESAFWATWNYLKSRTNSRRGETTYETAPFLKASGASGIIDTRNGAYANRGAAWSLRTLAQTLAICPTEHPIYSSLIAAWEANTEFYNSTFVTGTFAPGWVSPQGYLGEYSSGGDSLYQPVNATTAWYGAAWMMNFSIQTWGFSSDLGLPQSATSLAWHIAVRDNSYKLVVGRADDGLSGRYNWRRFAVYSYPIGVNASGLPPETWFTAAQSYAEMVSGFGLSGSLSAAAGSTLLQHSSDSAVGVGDSTSTDYLPFALSALAYAVQHGAPGASAGWGRVSGASNFVSALAALNDSPEHAFTPSQDPAYVNSFLSYSVDFSGTEAALVDDGGWQNGNSFTGQFGNVQIANGVACGTTISTGSYDDSVACRPWQSNYMEVTGVIYLVAGYTPPINHELEMVTMVTMASGSCKLYEVLINTGGNAQFVRWNGAMGDITVLNPTGNGLQGATPKDGDVFKVVADARTAGRTVITAYLNGVSFYTYTDTDAARLSSGGPGMSFFARPGSTLSSYGLRSWTARNYPMPAWGAALAVNQWAQLANSSLSAQPYLANSGSGSPQGKQDAWDGWHVNPHTSIVYSVGQGGHDDYWGNEVNAIDLTANTPVWRQLSAPTSVGSVTQDSEYYADGHPASIHGYHTSVFSTKLQKALRFFGGARSKSGNPVQTITAFNIATGQWDASSAWSAVPSPTLVGGGNGSYAIHPTTGSVYCWLYNSGLYRWNSGSPGSITTLISGPPNPAPFYTAAACAPSRGTSGLGEVFFLGGGDPSAMCRKYDIGANTLTTITLTGTNIASSSGISLFWCGPLQCYFACIPTASGSAVYKITPNATASWPCALLATTGGSALPDTSSNSAYYPFTKFLYLPALGVALFGPRWADNVWVLRLQ